jgi:hypothetical protein
MSNIFDRMLQELQPTPNAEPGFSEGLTEATEPISESQARVTSVEIKQVAQELLKHGYLEEAKRADLFRRAIALQTEVTQVLEPLDLIVKIDSYRGIAYLATASTTTVVVSEVDEEAAWSHPLVRRQRLTLEQSLLVAILRQAFVLHEQESGIGSREATIAVDELLPQFLVYLGDSGSDAKNESRLLNLLDQLKTYGIVSEVDKKQEVTIRPLIAHLANPESLTALLRALNDKVKDNTPTASTGGDDEC